MQSVTGAKNCFMAEDRKTEEISKGRVAAVLTGNQNRPHQIRMELFYIVKKRLFIPKG